MCRVEGNKGRKMGNYNSIINKIYFKKKKGNKIYILKLERTENANTMSPP